MTTIQQQQSDILPLSHSTYTAQLFRTSLFSDCAIYSNYRVWHLHRCILSPRCEFFWKCFQGSFEEASTATVEMHDDNPETLERMLKWIYLLSYPVLEKENSKLTSWTKDLQLYMMADKYGLTALMDATRQELVNKSVRCVSHAENLADSVDDFVEAMQMLYVELPERVDVVALRDELLHNMAPVIAQQIRQLHVLEELMITISGFAVGLVESLALQDSSRKLSASSLSSVSIGSGSSYSDSGSGSPRYVKAHIPLNEDSEDELE